MKRWSITAIILAALVAVPGRVVPAAAEGASFAGTWTINRPLSQFPREVGFGMDLLPAGGTDSGDRGDSAGGEGRRGGGGGAGILTPRRESEEDAEKTRQLVGEVKNPSARLTIAQTETAVSITDDKGRTRTFHPNGREEFQQLDAGPVSTTTKWEGTRLVVRYKVAQDRELRYTYSRKLDPPQLLAQAEFIERGGHDSVTRVYDPAGAHAPLPIEPVAPPAPSPQPDPRLKGVPNAPDFARSAVPASGEAAALPAPPQKPDAELKGITQLGVVVEDLTSQAAACGLDRAVIEAAVSRSLTDSGFKVARDSDEDTYVYINIITTSVSPSLCISRYDAFLYTHTTATLSYQESPLLVLVSLVHKGGIAGGGPKDHADGVVRNLKQYVDQFATRIRGANP